MTPVGYQHLVDIGHLQVVPLRSPARIHPVGRITVINGELAVPARTAPEAGQVLSHVLFALQYEGTRLDILAQVLLQVDEAALVERLRASPTGRYLRIAGFLWEHFNGRVLGYAPVHTAPYVPLFDPLRYITAPGERNVRWHIDFNGLGSLDYCATVERTAGITQLLQQDTLKQATDFFASMPAVMLDRAVSWAYLAETRDSYAIERETVEPDKQQAFIQLLHEAHGAQPLTEAYLVELQNSIVRHPQDRAVEFRTEQNHLADGGMGALGVRYVPPAPDLMFDLMQGFMAAANRLPRLIDPVVAAAIASFGFVYLHPFMDGNGRLSRFLFHHALCRSGRLADGLLLPVSVAIGKAEHDYLHTLQRISKPLRGMWKVTWISGLDYDFEFAGHPAAYRYWDATDCTEFGLRMAQRALEVEMRQETDFLAAYDTVVRAVGERYDVRNTVLSLLVRQCLQNGGVLSRHRRKQNYTVPDEVLDFIQERAQAVLGSLRKHDIGDAEGGAADAADTPGA